MSCMEASPPMPMRHDWFAVLVVVIEIGVLLTAAALVYAAYHS
jgi:hypothetical protein